MKKIKTVIFDLDGLLIDSEKISYHLYQDLAESYGHHFSVDEYAGHYSGKTGEGNMISLIEQFRLPITMEEGLKWVKEREKKYMEQGIELKAGVRQLLEYLQQNRYKVMLASSSTRKRAVEILQSHQIEGYFDSMVFGAEIERGKPFPDIFLKACEKAGNAPEECLVLEDSEAGIQAAYEAGVPVICIPDMRRPEPKYEKMTEKVMDSLADVIGYLEDAAAE